MRPPKRRIAILGGGIASLATAYSLTSAPDWRDHYDITVYQMGFRLGGKGASGRNQALANRIEEHGIHVFFGFYDNAFRIMKECYDELGRPDSAPLSRVTDAFKPHPRITFTEKLDGRWSIWQWDFPANEHRLGEGGPIPTPWGHVRSLLSHMSDWYSQVLHDAPPEVELALSVRAPHAGHGRRQPPADATPPLLDRLWRRGSPSALAAVREVIDALQRAADRIGPEPRRDRHGDHAALATLVRRARVVRDSARWVGRWLQEIPALRRALTLLDFATTTIIGLIEDELVYPPEDWRKIDDVDLKRWLQKHGAQQSTWDCALILGMYAGIFSTEHEVGAGTMLQYTLRMLFTYRGAILYKMQAGMGDVVFAPLYQVLARRGVKFEFFHRVDRLELDATKRRVARVLLGRQVALKKGPYEPLFDVKGLPCWPSEPLYDQIVDGDRLKESGCSLEDGWTEWEDALPPVTLTEGADFDLVVLGISLAALPRICEELVNDPNNPAFRAMLDAVKTTQTQAMQLWMKPDIEALGWTRGASIAIPYEEPFDTWTDMAHLIPRESWQRGVVGSIAYLCSPLPESEPVAPPSDHGYSKRQHERVKSNARGWLLAHSGRLWPRATQGNGSRALDWSVLADLAGREGEARLDAQLFVAPQNLSDRYNLSVPGSSRYRLPAAGSGYANLVLAGDWTLNPINAGCVEAATMSGLLAARAISGEPRVIPGDWLSPLLEREAAPSGGLPAYIPLDANDTPAPPYRAAGTRMTVFPVEARLDRIQALCDARLNLGGPVRYQAALPLALFYCQDNSMLTSAEPHAGIRELDFGFLVPLLATERGEAPRLVAFVPYLWVDSELACRGGREIYGFPKAEGRLSLPARGDGVFSVDAMIVERTPGRAPAWALRRVVEARPAWGAAGPGPEGADSGAPAAALMAALRSVQGASGALDLARSAMDTLASGTIPMVFLKQFRDVENPARACYQAVIEAPVRRIGGLRRAGRTGVPYELVLPENPTFPLAALLGLGGGAGATTVPVRSPFWMEFDFEMDAGRVVWQAPSGR